MAFHSTAWYPNNQINIIFYFKISSSIYPIICMCSISFSQLITISKLKHFVEVFHLLFPNLSISTNLNALRKKQQQMAIFWIASLNLAHFSCFFFINDARSLIELIRSQQFYCYVLFWFLECVCTCQLIFHLTPFWF